MKLNRYQQAQLGYVRTEAQRYQDTVQLLVATGGGWWNQKPIRGRRWQSGPGNDQQLRPTPTAIQH